MKKMYGFIGMSVRVCAFVVVLVFTSVAFAGCEYVNEFLGGVGLGGGIEGEPEADPEPEPKPTESMAEGGETTFIKVDNVWYEVHTFRDEGTWALIFSDQQGSVLADCLIVAGGGGGSITHTPGNGGGAGGVAEHTAYPLAAGSHTVVVGSGGLGGVIVDGPTMPLNGGNGGDSSFGDEFRAYGGGGGGGGYWGTMGGSSGGSSGGSGISTPAAASKGVVPSGGNVYGYPGAARARAIDGKADGFTQGGGGAGGPGQDANGGPGITRSITGTPVTYAAGGGANSPPHHGEQNTGNGGPGAHGASSGLSAFNGGSGIVIVRWPYVAP